MEINEEEFDEKIKSGEKFVVDFFATWCGPCVYFAPIFSEAGKRSDISFVKIDVDQCGDIAEKYGISSIPTVMVFEKGQAVKTHVGSFGNVDELLKFVL